MQQLRCLLQMMRPVQWIKNGFVFVGVLFSERLTGFGILWQVIIAAASFCLASSSVYLFNDIIDRDRDRHHPQKRNRPLPSGKLSAATAAWASLFLAILAIALAWLSSPAVCAIIIAYCLLNIAYSYRLKHIVIVDVFCIAAGFMLRIMAGTIGVGIPPSKWLLLCSLLVTLFLGFAKRRAEVMALGDSRQEHRGVLKSYTSELLDLFIAICVAGIIITYSLYTMSPETIRIHRTENLIYTVPFVIYALFRYIFMLHSINRGTDPAHDLIKDPQIMISVLGWAALTFYLI